MKLLLCFFVLSVLNVSGSSMFSQNATFKLAVNGKTVKEVFKEIESQSQYRFLYNDDFYGLNRVVSLNTKDNDCIDNVLTELLIDANLTYRELENDLIVITPSLQNVQQEHRVSGTVTDTQGESLPGVNVMIQGTTTGVITDTDGNYSLQVPDPSGVLVFSYVGYTRQVIQIENRSVIDVVLESDFLALDEVVVVGYGTQRAGTITGSISRAVVEDVARVTTPTVVQSLQGQAAGVFIKNEDYQPGSNTSQINIRGFGTPLFIVDGMPVSAEVFQNIDPNDIQELNILKDAASAAVYGARAGNGVILVQTKRGLLSEPQFTFSSDLTAQYLLPHTKYKIVNTHEWMELRNMVWEFYDRELPFTREEIELYRQHADGSEPELYPNVNIQDYVLKDFAPMSQYNLSVRGGEGNISYFLSGNYQNQRGILVSDEINFNRYSFRSNVDIRLHERLSLQADVSLAKRDYIGPRTDLGGTDSPWNIMARIRRWRPFHPVEPLPDPTYPRGAIGGGTQNPINMMKSDVVGYKQYEGLYSDIKLNLRYDITNSLNTRLVFNYNKDDYRFKQFQRAATEYQYNQETGQYFVVRGNYGRIQLNQQDDIRDNLIGQYFLEYNKRLADVHSLNGLFVAEYMTDRYDRFDAWRLNYDIDLDQLFAGPAGFQFNNSSANEGGRMGYIGRLNYSYAGKYTIEVNSRMDGSPRFPEGRRWGFFPSASASWLISEENFFAESASLSFINSLKFRGSYGKLGYDAAGYFQYLSTFRFASNYIFSGTSLNRGIRTDAIPNPNITWEEMYLTNLGVDFILWRGLLGGSFDIYQRDRVNVLGIRIRDIPDVIGATMPEENYQEFQNRGMELGLNHNNQVGSVNYRIGGNIGINESITKYTDEIDFSNKESERRNTRIGRWPNAIWKYPSDGLFQSQEEIDNWADIDGRNNATIRPGDVRYIDTNGDGRITPDDMVIVSSGSMPRLTYGLNASLAWRGFDFFMTWQGAGLFGFNLRASEYYVPFGSDGAPLEHHLNDSYVPEGNQWRPANTDARWPRLTHSDGFHNRSYSNDLEHWWINGRYLRLRNLQIGYTIPDNLTRTAGIDRLRVYFSAYNLLTFSDLDFLDPEIDNRNPPNRYHGQPFVGSYYPQMGSFQFGIELMF